MARSTTSDTICRAHGTNLSTIIKAAKAGDLALVEGQVRSTGEVVAMLCAVGRDGDDYTITPFGHLINGNPFEYYNPPNADGGFHTPSPSSKVK